MSFGEGTLRDDELSFGDSLRVVYRIFLEILFTHFRVEPIMVRLGMPARGALDHAVGYIGR